MAKCKYCDRELPNKEHITKNGCKWCDMEYRKGLKDKKKKCYSRRIGGYKK